MAKILIVLSVAAVAFARPSAGPYPEPFVPAAAPDAPIYSPAPAIQVPSSEYQYAYSVNDAFTGDHKTQVERRDGDIVQGSYSLVEADGVSRRVVDYSADAVNGFNAVVHHEPAVAPAAVRAEPVAVAPTHIAPAPAIRAEPVAVAPAHYAPAPAIRAEPVAVAQAHYAPAPAIRAEPVAVAQAHYAPAPAIRAEPVAVAPAYHYTQYTPAVKTEVALAPQVRTHVSYRPVVRNEPVPVAPPAVSSQTISHTTNTVHPQQIAYRQYVDNVPVTTQEIVHEPVAVSTPAVRAEHVAVAPAIQPHYAPAIQRHYAPAIHPDQYYPSAAPVAY